jgi:hypothetical protein
MKVTVVASPLIGFVFPHQREKLFSGPAFSLEVVVVGRRGTRVHHEVDTASAAKNVSTRDHCPTPIEIIRRPRIVERCGFAVELHIDRIDAWTVNPWVVQVVLTAFNQEHLKVMIKVGQTCSVLGHIMACFGKVLTASRHTPCTPSTTYDHINLVRDSHCAFSRGNLILRIGDVTT